MKKAVFSVLNVQTVITLCCNCNHVDMSSHEEGCLQYFKFSIKQQIVEKVMICVSLFPKVFRGFTSIAVFVTAYTT